MHNRLLLMTVSAAMLAVALNAQRPTVDVLTVACVKVTPGKSAEFRQFVTDTSKKIAEARLKSGEIVTWALARSVYPAGDEARCDYTIATGYHGIPPASNDMAALAKSIEKAGVKMTAAQYLAKRDSLSRLVALEMWHPEARVGQLDKGSYYFLNHMKVHDEEAYLKFETEIWRPMAEVWVKEGVLKGWRFNVLMLPAGTETPYAALSLDIFPNWESALKDGRTVQETFKKVHPGKDYETVMAPLAHLRDLARRDLMHVEEIVKNN